MKNIGGYSFSECYNLKNVFIEEGVESIGGYAFSYFRDLESILIPASVTSISDDAFYGIYEHNITIYGYTGSYAQTFANSNDNLDFVALDSFAKGDLNDDGNINLSDYALAKSYLQGAELTPVQLAKADYTNDHAVDVVDLFSFNKAINA